MLRNIILCLTTSLPVALAWTPVGGAAPLPAALDESPGPTAAAQQPEGKASAPTHMLITTQSAPDCNCTGGPADVTVCHAEQVTISVGGTPLTLTTGKSGSGCTTAELANGECLYFEYTYRCTSRGWLVKSWDCEFVNSKARKTTASC